MNKQTIKIKRQRDKLQRALEREQQRGRLLRAKLDSAQHEVYLFRKLLEIAHNNTIFDDIVYNECPENERAYPMGSLLGRMSNHAPLEKQDGLVGETVGNYALGPFLGKGGFGRVYTGTHINTDKEYAIKVLDKKKIIRARRFKMVEQEIAVMQKVAHPNVVCLHDIVIHPDYICLVMDLGSTDLHSWVHYWRNEYYDIDAPVCREIILGIVKPMQHLHALGIAHLDVKDENILVTKHVWVEHLRQDHIKLCDFGLSAISTSPDASFKESGICGTTGYFAPEMAQDDDYDARAADMFSVGCTLLNVIGKVPDEWDKTYRYLKSNKAEFQKQMRSLLMQMHVDDCYFEGIAFPVAQIIRSLLKFDPKERPTPAELLQNPWLAEDS
jgi:serine/threonine protein kinase